MAEHGWLVYSESPDRDLLAAALDALEKVGHHLDDNLLATYAAAATQVAHADVAHLPADDDRQQTVEVTVLITVLGGPVLLALRRLAQQSASARRYGASYLTEPAGS